jgi:hypothetical protein
MNIFDGLNRFGLVDIGQRGWREIEEQAEKGKYLLLSSLPSNLC